MTKKIARLQKIFSHINLSLSQKQRYEQKPLSFRSALNFCSAPKSLEIFSLVSFPASKITPIKLIKKKHSRTSPDVQLKEFSLTKQKTTYNGLNEMRNPFLKKSDKKFFKKNKKIGVKLPHVNKKTTSEKSNFCSNTVFSLCFKIRATKIHAAKPLAF